MKIIKRKTKTRYNFVLDLLPLGVSPSYHTAIKGECDKAFIKTRTVDIYVKGHESIDDIINSVNHESYHSAIRELRINMSDLKEHNLIRFIQWIDYYV